MYTRWAQKPVINGEANPYFTHLFSAIYRG